MDRDVHSDGEGVNPLTVQMYGCISRSRRDKFYFQTNIRLNKMTPADKCQKVKSTTSCVSLKQLCRDAQNILEMHVSTQNHRPVRPHKLTQSTLPEATTSPVEKHRLPLIPPTEAGFQQSDCHSQPFPQKTPLSYGLLLPSPVPSVPCLFSAAASFSLLGALTI